ncbi:reverse transcriptase domain-containing protein [Tanacetum coccineum]
MSQPMMQCCDTCKTQGQNLHTNGKLTDMLSKLVTDKYSLLLPVLETLPGNTVTKPEGRFKGIIPEVGVTIQGPKAVTNDTAVPKASIPFPSRRNDERRKEKANDQIEKFYEIFRDLSFEISFTDALMLMPKFASTLKTLIGNKEKLSELARTPLNENCSAVILNKLPKKLGDPGRFLIPCEFTGITTCNALADLGASINLMPYSVWKSLSLSDLTPTCMTLELADRSITEPIGIAEDVFVNVGKFQFPADFVVVDFEPDPRLFSTYDGQQKSHASIWFADEYSQEVPRIFKCWSLKWQIPLPYFEPIVAYTFSNSHSFGAVTFSCLRSRFVLALDDDPTSSEVVPTYQIFLRGERAQTCVEAKTVEPSMMTSDGRTQELPPNLDYAFLEG